MDVIYRSIIAVAGHTRWAPIATRTGFRVLNLEQTPNVEYHRAVIGAVQQAAGPSVVVKRFGSIGNMVENDWSEAPDGQGYRSRIGEAGRPDLQGWADDLRRQVAEVNSRYAAKYGWGEATAAAPAQPARGLPLQTLAQGGQTAPRGIPLGRVGLSMS
jgi:hypothetical protein